MRVETKAKPALKRQKTTEIELALIELEATTDSKAKPKHLEELIAQLQRYEPVIQADAKKGQTDGYPHMEMKEVALMFAEKAEKEKQEDLNQV